MSTATIAAPTSPSVTVVALGLDHALNATQCLLYVVALDWVKQISRKYVIKFDFEMIANITLHAYMWNQTVTEELYIICGHTQLPYMYTCIIRKLKLCIH